jgi:hypothetical protein
MTDSASSRQRSNDIARARDARVRWLLEMHPVTASMLVRLGWFPSKNKALRRLNRLVEKGRVRLVGVVSRKAGRPESVYCCWRPKPDQLLHDVTLTQLCLRLDAGRILRGPHVIDQRARPDAEVWINGRLYYLELDRGTMSHEQIVRRFRKYENCRHLVLWVCPTEARREGLRLRAERIRSVALFTTLAEALDSPHAEIWVDYQGHKASLPRQGRPEDDEPNHPPEHHERPDWSEILPSGGGGEESGEGTA